MTITPAALTYSLAYGGDGIARTNDPQGAFGRGTEGVATIAPIITLVTPKNTQPAQGSTVTVTFRNTGGDGYFFRNKCPDGVTISLSQDRKEATLTWVTSLNDRIDSYYMSVGCQNIHGLAFAYDIVHLGKTQVITCGPAVGNDYANWRLANQVLVSGGTCIFQKGTSASKDFWIGVPDGQSGAYLPPPGIFTEQLVNGEMKRTVAGFTTVMCEEPLGFVFDCTNLGLYEYGLMIYGTEDYDQKEKDFDTYLSGLLGGNYFAKFNTPQFSGPKAQTAISVKGFITKGKYIYFNRCAWVYAQFCGSITNKGDYIGISLRGPVKDILTEYCYTNGRARNAWSTYKGKNVITRRMIFRSEEQPDINEPIGGLTMYQVRGGRAQNCYDIGSNSGEFWTAHRISGRVMPSAGSFVNPESDFRNDNVLDYSNDVVWQNCGACDTDRSLFNIDSRERPVTDDSIGFDGLFATEIMVEESSCSLIDTGPLKGSNLWVQKVASKYGTQLDVNSYGSNWFRAYQGKQDIDRFILADLGFDRTTKNTIDAGRLWYSESTSPQKMSNGYVWNFKGNIVQNTQYLTATNVNYEVLNPYTNGLRYAHRIERGSVLYGLGFTRNTWFGVGRAGQFFGDPGYQEQLNNTHWIEQTLVEAETFWALVRPVTFTGQKNLTATTLTTGTLAWGRNIALAGESWPEYVMKKSHNAPTPYPYRIMVYKNGGTLYVDICPFSTLNRTGITGYNIYANNQKIGSITNNAFGYRNTSLTPGQTYSITATAESASGESGHSEPVEVTI